MARLNTPVKRPAIKTHEGARAAHASPEQRLRRQVLACLLWEDGFYESGGTLADAILETAKECSPAVVANLAREARNEYRLRHVPLWLTQSLIGRSGGGGQAGAKAICDVIQRPDEICEILAMYWKDGKRPLPRALKLGIAQAFNKFDEYQFAKWNRKGAVKLKDAMFMCRPNPKDDTQAQIFQRIANDQLAIPETREVRLSRGDNPKEMYTDMLTRNKLGYMALLKNLRTMLDAGVPRELIKKSLLDGAARSKALPFRFITAANHAGELEDVLNQAMLQAFADLPTLPGTTSILVDVSGSMCSPVSVRSEMQCVDAASALAVYAKEASNDCRVFAFGTDCKEVRPRRGLPLIEEIRSVNNWNSGGFYGNGVGHGTNIGKSMSTAMKEMGDHDRMIVITDMQSHDAMPSRLPKHSYIVNVAGYQNSIASEHRVTHITGFSEQTMRYIAEVEGLNLGDIDN